MLQALFLRVEVRHRGATGEAAAGARGVALQQERLDQGGFARTGLSDQRDITDARSGVPHGMLLREAGPARALSITGNGKSLLRPAGPRLLATQVDRGSGRDAG